MLTIKDYLFMCHIGFYIYNENKIEAILKVKVISSFLVCNNNRYHFLRPMKNARGLVELRHLV